MAFGVVIAPNAITSVTYITLIECIAAGVGHSKRSDQHKPKQEKP
jgi:hypothetical protein